MLLLLLLPTSLVAAATSRTLCNAFPADKVFAAALKRLRGAADDTGAVGRKRFEVLSLYFGDLNANS